MKIKSLVCVAIAALVTLFTRGSARADEEKLLDRFSVTLGYREYKLQHPTYSHNTHPNDSFLPRASVPGSAGTTTLDGKLRFGAVGFRYDQPIAPTRTSNRLKLNVDLGGLFGGARDDHQNNNDPRPAGNGAFVYSEANFGMYAGTGLSYEIGRFYVGVQAELGGLFIDRGWDRYSTDQSTQSQLKFFPSVGPKIGYRFTDNFRTEASVQFGNATMFTLGLIFNGKNW